MKAIQQHLTGHIIVAGYGSSGSEAVSELVHRGTDARMIVVIDENPAALRAAEDCGTTVMEGNATRDLALVAAQIDKAAAMIVSAGRDDTSILIVLTARRLAPAVPISVVIRSEDNEAIAYQAGANTVINPASFAGLLLAGSTHGAHIAGYMADLAAAGGQVALRERPVADEEIGQSLSSIRTGLGHRIYRGGRSIEFWEAEADNLQRGDAVIEVVSRRDRTGPS